MSNRTRPTKSGARARPAPALETDHWWSCHPPEERRPLGQRLLWNTWEFRHPWKVLGAAVGGIVVVVMIASIVLVATGGDGDDDTVTAGGDDTGGGVSLDLAFGQVEVVGDPLPPLPQGGADPAIGVTAPAVRGFGPDSIEQAFVNGQPRAIMFVAHWCPHCQDELNEINAFIDGGGTLPSGVEIQTIATWSDQGRENFPPGEWLADNDWPHRTIVDDEAFTLAGSLGLAGTPMWIFIEADGTIVERTGSLPVADLVSRLESLGA